MKTLTLYATEGCHLCDIAKALIWPLLENTDYHLEEIDIAEDEQLLALYALTIPVLVGPNNEQQCSWPFDAEQIQKLMAE